MHTLCSSRFESSGRDARATGPEEKRYAPHATGSKMVAAAGHTLINIILPPIHTDASVLALYPHRGYRRTVR